MSGAYFAKWCCVKGKNLLHIRARESDDNRVASPLPRKFSLPVSELLRMNRSSLVRYASSGTIPRPALVLTRGTEQLGDSISVDSELPAGTRLALPAPDVYWHYAPKELLPLDWEVSAGPSTPGDTENVSLTILVRATLPAYARARRCPVLSVYGATGPGARWYEAAVYA
eukprot:1735599-Rhodomonas_salina.1